jgi:D,D-heptose 1,7-bisphosphate phosphatase
MKQAVILAGGLGVRLLPLTKDTPKPMVQVQNRPFICQIINDLRSKGVEEFIILTGHLQEQIANHFVNDTSVTCVKTDTNFTKSQRLLFADKLIAKEFILLYGDNFIPENIAMTIPKNFEAVLTATRKIPGNVKLIDGSKMAIYSEIRKDDFDYVELGYLLLKKKSLFSLLSQEMELEGALKVLSEEKSVTFHVIQGPYFSISDPERLRICREAFNGKKIIFIDRDGIINKRMPKGQYLTKIQDCEFISENIQGMKKLSDDGFKFVVISNQAGIARGMINQMELDLVTAHILGYLAREDIEVLDVYYCIHGWDENCLCRKPLPGMLFSAAKKFNILLSQSIFIGDDIRDSQAAIAAGCHPILVDNEITEDFILYQMDKFESIMVAVERITQFYTKTID